MEDDGLIEQAERLLASGHHDEARAIVSQLTRDAWTQSHPTQIARIGRILAEVGGSQEALRLLESFLVQAPQALDVRRLAARIAVRSALGEHGADRLDLLRRAESHVLPVLAERPSDARAHALAGVVFERQGRLQEAVEVWRCAQVLDPSDLDYRVGLAVALCSVGRFREAIPHFEMVAAARTDKPEVHINLGLALRESGELERALSAFEMAAALDPQSARILVDLGLTLRTMGKLDQALDMFEQAIRLEPERADSYHQMGRALLRAGRFEEASGALDHALALDPHNPNIQRALLELARVPSSADDEDTLAVPAAVGSDLTADLGRFAVPDLVEFLGLGRRTGLLQVRAGTVHAEVEFIEGRLLSGRLEDEAPFSEQLVSMGVRMPPGLAQLELGRGAGPLLEALILDGVEDFKPALEELTYESSVRTLLALLQVNEGVAEFRSRGLGQPGQSSSLLEYGTAAQGVLLEVFRRYDELSAL